MRLVKQNSMNERHIKKGKSESTEPYPNLTKQVLNLGDDEVGSTYDLFMKKAYFKGDKGTVIPKFVPSRLDEHGKQWYSTSALETKKHLVTGQGDFHHVIKFNNPYKVKGKDLRNPNFKLYRSD